MVGIDYFLGITELFALQYPNVVKLGYTHAHICTHYIERLKTFPVQCVNSQL